MKRILLIDNYDSFTYNLVQLVMTTELVGIVVKRNDECSPSHIRRLSPDGIIISPGPKRPQDAGCSLQIIGEFGACLPFLGVCLGMQCINEAFGGTTREAAVPVHGKTSQLFHNGEYLFGGLNNPLVVARYHSLVIDNIPACLDVDAYTEIDVHGKRDRIPMALHHSEYPIFGVQFHPESFLTESGNTIMKNFLNVI